jgi:hypothetical protein
MPSIPFTIPVGAAPPVEVELELELPVAALALLVVPPVVSAPEAVSPPSVVTSLRAPSQHSEEETKHERETCDFAFLRKYTYPVAIAVAAVALPVIAPTPWVPLVV